jgi:hypothetical protein
VAGPAGAGGTRAGGAGALSLPGAGTGLQAGAAANPLGLWHCIQAPCAPENARDLNLLLAKAAQIQRHTQADRQVARAPNNRAIGQEKRMRSG